MELIAPRTMAGPARLMTGSITETLERLRKFEAAADEATLITLAICKLLRASGRRLERQRELFRRRRGIRRKRCRNI